MLLEQVLKRELSFSKLTIIIGKDIVYKEGGDINSMEYTTNLTKRLVDLSGGEQVGCRGCQ